ncbi:hypothetical protein GW17_00007799 [Ensete ventricosum]|nr:hypothetical protein GW17_00007799 [Ensete ventricosum]
MGSRRPSPSSSSSSPPSTRADLCAVCLDEVQAKQRVTRLPCSHKYHTECTHPSITLPNERWSEEMLPPGTRSRQPYASASSSIAPMIAQGTRPQPALRLCLILNSARDNLGTQVLVVLCLNLVLGSFLRASTSLYSTPLLLGCISNTRDGLGTYAIATLC